MNTAYKEINKEFGVWLNTLGFSWAIVYDYPKRAADFFEWLQTKNTHQISKINQKHIENYFKYLQKRPNKRKSGLLSASYLNDNYIVIDKLLEFLHSQGVKNIPTPTGYRINLNQEERINKIIPLTQSEVKELYSSIENSYPDRSFTDREAKHYQLKLIFTLYYGCGLRRSEGYRLTFDDINFNNRTVFVQKGKGYKDRIIPMSENVYKTLQDYIYNFRNQRSLPHKRLFIYSTGALNNNLQHLQSISENKAIRAKKITLHLLRHSIATHLLQNGMKIEKISQFLGHSSLEATQIYTHIAERE